MNREEKNRFRAVLIPMDLMEIRLAGERIIGYVINVSQAGNRFVVPCPFRVLMDSSDRASKQSFFIY